jgi:hypothetical protein
MDHSWQDLLFYLHHDGNLWFRSLAREDWRRELIGSHGAVEMLDLQIMKGDWEVQNHFRSNSTPADTGPKKGFVIRPCKHAESSLTIMVPFIMAGGANPRLSLQLGVLERVAERPDFFFGYRFESPEAHEEHKFHHAQPVQSFGHGAGSLNLGALGYPNRYPTFPLAASNACELVASVLVTIREWPKLTELTTPSSIIPREARQAVGALMQKIRCG